jgi:hypothetical protein
MTPKEAVQAVHKGRTVQCTVDEYSEIRRALQDQAGKWIDQGDHVHSYIALLEVRRLDHIFNYEPFS